jgi:hypothetical protein
MALTVGPLVTQVQDSRYENKLRQCSGGICGIRMANVLQHIYRKFSFVIKDDILPTYILM